MVRVLSDPKTVAALMAAGAEPAPGSPEQFKTFLANELKKWSDTIKSANIVAD
jgi:tripartite-type tricarboxylate transporter receptor subunit TctC